MRTSSAERAVEASEERSEAMLPSAASAREASLDTAVEEVVMAARIDSPLNMLANAATSPTSARLTAASPRTLKNRPFAAVIETSRLPAPVGANEPRTTSSALPIIIPPATSSARSAPTRFI